MSDSSEAPIPEERIREIAHRVWEAEGRPQNQAMRHWHIAERLAAASAAREQHGSLKAKNPTMDTPDARTESQPGQTTKRRKEKIHDSQRK